MDCTAAFEKIDQLFSEYVTLWQDICNLESPTESKVHVDAVGHYLVRHAAQRGWQVEVLPQSRSGDAICITMNSDVPAAPLCLSGHMDTVHPVGSFGSPAVRMEDGRIYGPGVCDCKGGIVASLLAMDALAQIGYDKRPIRLILQSDEEVGSSFSQLATVRFMCEKGRDAVAFLNMEGYSPDKTCLIRKGIINFEFVVTGQEAHASDCATVGANAVIEAAHKMLMLDQIRDANGLTCCCSMISGGSAFNTVPAECRFVVNVRFATREQEAWIMEYARKVAETVHVPGCTCTVSVKTHRIAMELSEKNTALLEQVNSIFRANGIPELAIGSSKGGSDAAYVTDAGIPCLDSVGVAGGKIHSPGEYAVIESLRHSARRVAVIACQLLTPPAGHDTMSP